MTWEQRFLARNPAAERSPADSLPPRSAAGDSADAAGRWGSARSGAETLPPSVCKPAPVRERPHCPGAAVRPRVRNTEGRPLPASGHARQIFPGQRCPKSMMSCVPVASAEFEEILRTGAIGLPVGVPRPVANRTTFALEPTCAVTHSTKVKRQTRANRLLSAVATTNSGSWATLRMGSKRAA